MLYEKLLMPSCFTCRKGHETLDGVNRGMQGAWLVFADTGYFGVSLPTSQVNTNAVGVVLSCVWMLFRGELWGVLATCSESPIFVGHLTMIGMAMSAAILCYTSMIKQSGPVTAVGVATVRKAVTMMLSYVLFPKRVSFFSSKRRLYERVYRCRYYLLDLQVIRSESVHYVLLPLSPTDRNNAGCRNCRNYSGAAFLRGSLNLRTSWA